MRARSAVRDLQHKRSGRVLYHTRDHSLSAVNRVLHDQVHALTGLLYDTL